MMIQHFPTLLFYFDNKNVSKKSQKNLLKNQSEFCTLQFHEKKKFHKWSHIPSFVPWISSARGWSWSNVSLHIVLLWQQKCFIKEPKNLLKNQSEFCTLQFDEKKRSFTNEVTYHLSSPEFPPLEVDDDPTFPVIVSVWWLLLPLPTLPTTPPPLLSPATPFVL